MCFGSFRNFAKQVCGMMKKVSGFILKLMGWKILVDEQFRKVDKAIVVMAPHTSMKDFWIGRFAFWNICLPVGFLIKKEMFWFPMGMMLRSMGGIPVNRKKSGSLTESVVNLFRSKDRLMLVITPEGTRKYNPQWKRGFYRIAEMAEVPILLGYVDYKTKVAGIGKLFFPSGNYESDLQEIQKFYYDISARYPEKFHLSPMYRMEKYSGFSKDTESSEQNNRQPQQD